MWSKIILMPTMIMILPMMALSMTSTFFLWLMIELNTLMFIFFMIYNNDKNKSLMNYFIIQTFTSLMLIYLITFDNNMYNMYMLSLINFMLNIILWMKMGMIPFHNWFINIMKNCSWMSCLIATTSQKLIILIMWNKCMNLMILHLIILLSTSFALLNMFNSNELKMIMSFSSIIHSSWMLMNMSLNINMMLVYYMIYFCINTNYMYMLNKWNLNNLMEMFNMPHNLLKLFLILTLSINSIPPFSGFYMKWMSIENLKFSSWIILFLLIFSSLLSIYFYFQISMLGFFNYYYKSKKLYLDIDGMYLPFYMNFFLLMSIISPSTILLMYTM